MVDTQDGEDEPEYTFTVGGKKQEKIEVIIGGCKLSMIIDSGASTNIIDKQTWEWLKRNKVKCKSARSDKKLFAYASQTPLDVIGTFSCEVFAGKNTTNAKFCVINGKRDPLLGRDTATSLGVLKIAIDIASVDTSSQTIGEILQEKYQWRRETEGSSSTTSHGPKREAGSAADTEDSFQSEIKRWKRRSKN